MTKKIKIRRKVVVSEERKDQSGRVLQPGERVFEFVADRNGIKGLNAIGYETLNSMIVDLDLVKEVVKQNMLEQSQRRVIIPPIGGMPGLPGPRRN